MYGMPKHTDKQTKRQTKEPRVRARRIGYWSATTRHVVASWRRDGWGAGNTKSRTGYRRRMVPGSSCVGVMVIVVVVVGVVL